MMTHAPDRIYATGNDVTGSWNATEGNPKLYPHQNRYLLSTPAREAAPDLLEALQFYADRFAIDPAGDIARAAIAKAKGGV